MKKFIIETYGCQMNVYDSEMIEQHLIENGFTKAEKIHEADIIMFNTCSVRQRAEDRVMGRISNEFGRKKAKPNLKIGVLGCMAQRLKDELFDKKNQVDFVVGVDQYKELPNILKNLDDDFHQIEVTENSQEIYEKIYPKVSRIDKTSAFVTIMRGCDNFCTYCIVPYVRHRERSRPVVDILNEIKEAVQQGFKEVSVLGQNVNSYLYENTTFPELLKEIVKIEGVERLRFVTSHPKDLSDELIQVIAENKKVCNHIHLPMQSGNTEILTRMNRGYTAEKYFNLVQKLKKAVPEMAVTTDIIVGFPGETEEQYNDTVEMMKKIEFDFAFMFKYSPRRGTKAAEYTDQIPEEIRLKRLADLIEMQSKITRKKYLEQIGKIKYVNVESVSKKSDEELAGKTDDFKITVFKGEKNLIGKIVKVKIVDAVGWTLRGEIV